MAESYFLFCLCIKENRHLFPLETNSIFTDMPKHITLPDCPGFIWDSIDFLHSALYDAMLWLQEKNTVGNTLMF